MATPTIAPPAPGDLAFDTLDREGWPLLRPTLLTIHRTAPDDARTRQVYFSLDGKRIATLLFGQQVTREITPGQHTLRANNTLVWKTVKFEADPGAHVHYTCVNRAPSSLYFLLFIFGVAPLYVVLRPGAPAPASSAEN
jgi:hypothetical protein